MYDEDSIKLDRATLVAVIEETVLYMQADNQTFKDLIDSFYRSLEVIDAANRAKNKTASAAPKIVGPYGT